jgi:glycosyltransferase involved in cell wall biosynthesis
VPEPHPTLLLLGGNDRSLEANRGDLIRALLDRGWSVHAALPTLQAGELEAGLPIPIHRIPLKRAGLSPLSDFGAFRALRTLLQTLKPSLVLAYNPKPVIYGGLALRAFPEIPYLALITGRGALERRPGLKGALGALALHTLYRTSLSRPNRILFQNPDDEALFRARFPAVLKVATEVIPGSGVSLEHFPKLPLPTEADGARLPLRFLMLSKLLVDKGIREFVAAAAEVKRHHPEAEFRVVGGQDPSLPHALPASELERWKAEGGVEWVGAVEDVRPHLAWCTVLCHPSYAEGTPRAVLEALATGRPVVTTDAPGCRQTIEPGVSGLLVAPRSAASLAEGMLEMGRRTAGGELPPMADAARARAEAVYDVRKVNARILHHLEALRVGDE